ncbi:putative uncharacterized protein DDB_G0277255 isoform X2 [Tetranychus urticae]|uniref:putative uncharacterized protein DDB_G0277255 isoform X2 n=1 Tax=Tetranychus urticae TaxID=32264 RepID=UPI00077B9330|nr:putative uncharacterized protein DDB_G0277255 isoform X2 [Tetranychus urticae]
MVLLIDNLIESRLIYDQLYSLTFSSSSRLTSLISFIVVFSSLDESSAKYNMEGQYPNWSSPGYGEPAYGEQSPDFVTIQNPMDNLNTMSPHGYYSYYQSTLPTANSIFNSQTTSNDLSADPFYSSTTPGDPYSDESPLLEELGINFDQIMQKSLANVIPYKKVEQNSLHETDISNEHDHQHHGEQRSQQSQVQLQPQQAAMKNFARSLKTPPPLKYFGDLLSEKEDAITRSSNVPNISNETNLDSNNLSSSDSYVDDRSLGFMYQEFGQCGQSSSNNCDSLIVSNNNANNNNNNNTSNNNTNNNDNNNTLVGADDGSLNRSNSSDTQEDNQLLNSWEKSIPDELNYPFDSRIWPRFINSNVNHLPNVNVSSHATSKPPSVGHKYVTARPSLNYGHRPILPSLQPAQTTTLAYPYQRPIPIQPNLGYTHKVAPRFISPYMTTNVAGRDIILWSSRSPTNRMFSPQATSGTHPAHMASLSSLSEPGSVHNRLPMIISTSRVAFTGSVDDSSSPSSSCSTSSTPSPGLMDKKLYVNNPVLVNMLTCPQIPGLRNLAPAPDSSSSHLDEKSKSDILSGLIDVSGEKRKRSNRAVATTSREPIKREMRPKIFVIEQFKIGLFHVQSSNEGSRRNSSTQLKVIFSRRRFIYEFAFSTSNACDKKDNILPVQSHQSTPTIHRSNGAMGNGNTIASNNPTLVQQTNTKDPNVVYYVVAVPFDSVTGLNIDESTMYLTVDRVPCLFGGTSVRSKVLFEKAPKFDPSQGELENNALHCISLRPAQVGRLRTSLVDFDKRFADLLSSKIDRDPYSYRCKLPEGSKDKDEDKNKALNDCTIQPDSGQVLKKSKIEKFD